MWIPNIQGAAFVAGTAVAVVAASPVLAEDKYVFGVCQVSRPASGAEIRPVTDGGSYLFNYHGDDPRYKAGLSSGQFFAGAKVTLVKAPTHGKVVLVDDSHAIAWNWYHYTPQAGYVGQDRFVMQVDKNGVKVRIQYLIESMNADEPSIGYCDPETWKISGDNPNLANVLTVASQNLTFADLTGGAVGETLGTGANAQITLDDNAAGHGWYIDYTPYLNDEYLPTSNPLEWIAKPGSEAEGKMDLLTVLLHEYGHALGLDHSADSHDLMASTLLPGVRRLPSPEELELMAQLLGVAQETGSTSPVPYDPFSPPGTPLPTTISLAAFVAARQRRSKLKGDRPQILVPKLIM